MGYLTSDQLKKINFKNIGENVKISDKASLYDCSQMEIGDNSRIDDFCVISGKVVIGKYCHITPMCLVAGGIPGITFEDFSTVAYGVKVFAQSDDYSGESLVNSLIPKKFKNEFFSPVRLSRQVIVGAGTVIMPGVHIAEGCAVGAMSLVLKDTDPWGVYAGVPVKRLKERSNKLLNLERDFLFETEK